MKRWEPFALTLALALHAALSLDAARRLSPTWDEIAYPAAGVAQWTTQTIAINSEHTCLAKLFYGLPLLALHPTLPLVDPSWEHRDAFRFGYQFIFHNRVPAQRLVFWSRIPAVLFSIFTALLLFFWIRDLWGSAGAWASLVIYLSTPILLSRASLALLEMPMYFFILLSLYWHDRWARSLFPKYLLASGAAGGLALACKLSTLPLIGFLVLLELLGCPPVASFPKRLVHAATLLASCTLALVVVYLPWKGAWPALADAFANLALSQKEVPFYWHGHTLVHASSLLSWAAWLIKASPPVIFLSMLGAWAWRRSRQHQISLLHFAGFAAVCWLSALASKTALATVHISPVYLGLAGTAGGLGILWKAGPRHKRVILMVLLALTALDAWQIHPNYLSYFNALVGGKYNGWGWLADSDQDWGQALPPLANYLKSHGTPHLVLSYSGAADPRAYGLDYQDLFSPALVTSEYQGELIPPDDKPIYLAVATKVVQTESASFAWMLKNLEPKAMVSTCFFVYDITKNAEAFRWMGYLYLSMHRGKSAAWAFQRAQRLNPGNANDAKALKALGSVP